MALLTVDELKPFIGGDVAKNYKDEALEVFRASAVARIERAVGKQDDATPRITEAEQNLALTQLMVLFTRYDSYQTISNGQKTSTSRALDVEANRILNAIRKVHVA